MVLAVAGNTTQQYLGHANFHTKHHSHSLSMSDNDNAQLIAHNASNDNTRNCKVIKLLLQLGIRSQSGSGRF